MRNSNNPGNLSVVTRCDYCAVSCDLNCWVKFKDTSLLFCWQSVFLLLWDHSCPRPVALFGQQVSGANDGCCIPGCETSFKTPGHMLHSQPIRTTRHWCKSLAFGLPWSGLCQSWMSAQEAEFAEGFHSGMSELQLKLGTSSYLQIEKGHFRTWAGMLQK